jgi:hypothetical protein
LYRPPVVSHLAPFQVPPGAQPGDILRAKAKDGRNVKVAVPQGVQDGEIIRAVVPPLIPEEDLQVRKIRLFWIWNR